MIKWSNREWITKERWGEFHPEKPNVWYDPKAVAINEQDELRLYADYNPKSFGSIHPRIGVGMVSSVEDFGYGYFEVEAQMPKGEDLVPAFWAYSADVYPYVEVDIFEMWSEKHDYWSFWIRNPFKCFRDEMRLIWDGLKQSTRTFRGSNFSFRTPSEKMVKYGWLWTRTEMKFFRDGKCVKDIKDQSVISKFHGIKLHVIINMAVASHKLHVEGNETPMVVKYFKYNKIC